MIQRTRSALSATIVLSLWSLVAVLPAAAGEPACKPPISTCTGVSAAADCPLGCVCQCVPSCPNCRDCDARVCLPAQNAQCRTACDCQPGLACVDGQCLAGIVPVYCCEGRECPAGEQCQHQNGESDTCRGLPPRCRTACDCPEGQGCFDGSCTITDVPVYCCDEGDCPVGFPCQHRDGQDDHCQPQPECRTACDCEPGLGCFDGQCIAGFAPVFCCEGDQCPTGQQCQHRNGMYSRCSRACSTEVWACDTPGQSEQCGDGRVCSCTASCPFCDDCGPGACITPGAPTPYRCDDDGGCAQSGDRCVCVSSCPDCEDCPRQVCVPACGPDCNELSQAADMRLRRVVTRAGRCRADEQCVRVDTSTQCGGTCGAWVNRRFAVFVERAMKYVDAKVCSRYRALGCPYATPGCLAERGVCVEGRCRGIAIGPQ